MDNKRFTYFLPQLGRLNVELYPCATKCYHFLDKNHHIKRLKNIDQLGVIRNVYEGAHHPRWEYVILQLDLINRLCELYLARGLGLSSTTEFLGLNPSGAEILQIWVLLLNSGHLPGTFASERGLLRIFKESAIVRNTFKNGLRSIKEKQFLDELLEKEDIYSIHKILISFHLRRYRRLTDYDTERTKFAEFLQDILNFYLFVPDDGNLANRRFKLKSAFSRIRQISYLFLDSQYAPFPVNFDLSKIFLNLDDYYRDIFVEPESQIIKTLSSFDDLLSTGLYHSPQSISELGKHSLNIQEKLEEKDFSRYYVIQKYLLESNEFEPIKFSDDGYILQILFDLSMNTILKGIFRSELSFEEEKKWNRLFGKNNCLTTFQSSPNGNQFVINLRIFQNSHQEKNMVILGHFLKNFVALYFKFRKENRYRKASLERVFNHPSKELVLEILKYITYPELYFEFKDTYDQELHVLPISGSKSAPNKIESIFNSIKISDSRETELNALKGTLNYIDHRGKLLVSLSPILVYDEDREILTDLDGFALGFLNEELKVLLIEAKNQRRRRIRSCKEQLEKTLDKLNLKTSASKDITELPEFSCVFSYFAIDGKD